MVYNSIATIIEAMHYDYQKIPPMEDTLVQTLLLCYVLNSLFLHFKTVITLELPPYERLLAS
jgi:hypothetical protein